MTQIVKSGYLKRYSKSMFSGGWQTVWVILYSDSNLVIYKRQGDNEVKGKVHMKDVSKRFAFGNYTDGMEGRPQLPSGAAYSQMLAVPTRNNSKAKIYWFLAASDNELHEWMTAIVSTLPAPPQHNAHRQQQQAPIQAQTVPQTHAQYPPQPQPGYGGAAPPPYSPAPPAAGGIGFDGLAGGYPQQPQPGGMPYPQAPYPGQPGPYPQQPGYGPPPPQQQYAPPPQGYPQQQYQPYPQQGYAPQPAYGYQQQPRYAPPPQQQQQPQVVYVQQGGKKKSGGLGGLGGGNTTKLAAGLIGGAALGYGASRMMGGGFGGGFGGWGFGHHGSWSSLSSFGSCGSFGSFGSFD